MTTAQANQVSEVKKAFAIMSGLWDRTILKMTADEYQKAQIKAEEVIADLLDAKLDN